MVVSQDGATVQDLGSKNGTLLRGERIEGPTAVADLDELQVGSARMTIRILRGGELTVDEGTAVTRRMIDGPEELLAVLAESFGLRLPEGTRIEVPV